MTLRLLKFAFVFSVSVLAFQATTQAQACTSTQGCMDAGYTNIVDCSVQDCSSVFTSGSTCVVGSSGDDNILIFDNGGHAVCGNDGNDTVQFASAEGASFVWGGAGNDSLSGTDFNDFLFGEAGADTINGGGGDDNINGGADDDQIDGGDGNDTINGDAGNDILLGGTGNDTLSGGDGNDQLNGNAGVDSLSGNDGDDTLLSDSNADGDSYNGGGGNDKIFADDGANTINGGAGDDFVEGGGGNDTIIGGTGYDQLYGQTGDDDLQGNEDPDLLDGGDGFDTLDGGAANDTCVSGEDNLNCENLTAARLLSSVAYPHEGGTVIEWQTLFEAGTAGFELRVREGDKWRPLHRGLLAADVAGYAGAQYAFRLPSWDAQAEYEIREIENSGLRRSLGTLRATGLSQRPLTGLSEAIPFVSKSLEVDRTWRLAPLERTNRRLLNGAPTAAKVGVAERGIQRVALDSLASELRISVADLKSRLEGGTLSVALGDKQVAWASSDNHLVFVGDDSDSPYSAERFYRIELEQGARAAAIDLTVDPDANVLASYRATSEFEKDDFAARVVPIDPSGDTWFSHALSPTTPGKEEATVTVELGRYAGGDAVIEIELQGASFDPAVDTEHVFDVQVNGKLIGEVEMSGFDRETFSLPVASADLQDGANEVNIISTLRGSENSIVYLDRVSIDYDRKFEAQDDAIAFAAGSDGSVRIGGFTSSNVVLIEVSPDGTTRVIEGADIEAGDTVEVAFAVRKGARYWVSAKSQATAPWGDTRAPLRELTSGAHYVVVTRADLMAAAEKLATHRREQGFSTLVVDIDDVYDEYSGGQPTPDALRAFFKDAYERWSTKPQYAVLAGASHFDYRDRLGFGAPLVPAYQVRLHNGIVSSDLPIVDFNDDGVPEIALGRLPAANSEDLASMVTKIVAYEQLPSPAWANAVTLVADKSDNATNFAADLDRFAARLPEQLASTKLKRADLDPNAMRSSIASSVREGTSWLHYLGHGGLSQWSRGAGILASEDVDAWEANEAKPFVTAGTCLTGAYDFPGVRSLGEAWIGSQGGAIGLWGATASTIHSESDLYADHLRTAIADNGRLRIGDALLDASRAHAAEGTEFGLETLRAYTLLGDPTTVLHIAHPNPNVDYPGSGGQDVSQQLRPVETSYDNLTGPSAEPAAQDGGCSVTMSSSRSTLWVIAIVMGIVAARRRRRAL